MVIVHGGGGDRSGGVRHAQLLARHGYGVLVYDSRGRGNSEGSPIALGWGWTKDVAGALTFLRTRPDVDPKRIGGLGLSTGGDVLIEVAAARKDLRAVVSDGATGESFADYRNLKGIDAAAPYWWTLYTSTRILSGASPGEPLKDAVARVSPTPLLLIAAGRDVPAERDFNRSTQRLHASRSTSGTCQRWDTLQPSASVPATTSAASSACSTARCCAAAAADECFALYLPWQAAAKDGAPAFVQGVRRASAPSPSGTELVTKR